MSEKVYIESYGCQMNFADSEVVGAILTGAGYVLCETVEEADFVLINTCAIRDNAEQRVRHRVRELRAMQNRHANLRVGILGCMAERLQSRLMAEEDNVSFVCGPDAYRRLPDLLRQVREGQKGGNGPHLAWRAKPPGFSRVAARALDLCRGPQGPALVA